MIEWCLTLVYVAIVLSVGLSVSGIVVRSKPTPLLELFGLCAVVGAGVLGCMLLWCSLAGFKPTALVVLFIGGVSVVINVLMIRLGWIKFEQSTAEKSGLAELVCVTLLLLIIGTVAMHALAFPLYEWDAFAIWGLKAKVLAHESLASNPEYFQTLPLSYSHLDYPLLVPSLLSGSYALLGQANEQAAKVTCLLLFIGFVALFYSEVRRGMPAAGALVLTLLVISVPEWIRWTGTGLADVPLAIFHGSALIYAMRWLTFYRRSDLILMLAFGTFTALTKNEGLPTAAIVCAVVGFTIFLQRKWACLVQLLTGIIVAALAYLPWLLFNRGIPKTHENYGARLNWSEISANAARIEDIFRVFLQEFVNWQSWGIIWFVLLIGAALGGKKILKTKWFVLWLILFLQVTLYFVAFIVTPWNIRSLAFTALSRLFLHLLPVAGLIIALQNTNLLTALVSRSANESTKKREEI